MRDTCQRALARWVCRGGVAPGGLDAGLPSRRDVYCWPAGDCALLGSAAASSLASPLFCTPKTSP